jgi:oligopeptide transport system permease protein
MGKFIVKRILGTIPMMLVIITLCFFMMHLAPGGPFDREKQLPEIVMQNILAKYHMDEPLVMQYFRYLGDVIRGDFGPSYRVPDFTVSQLIATSFPTSITLGLTALLIAVVFGVGIGILSGLKQNSAIDYTGMSLAVVGVSIPSIVVGPVLMLIFAVILKWLPISGWITGRSGLKAIILPAITLSLGYFAYIARLTRASVIETLRSDYVRTARAKGLSYPTVIVKHVLKGALLPVVTYLGPAMAGIVTGSVVVERIFLIPGIGTWFVNSALNRDYTLIMGTVIVYSVILIMMNLVVDIVYAFLDPRISYK